MAQKPQRWLRVEIQLDLDQPDNTMYFVLHDRRSMRCITNHYAKKFPDYQCITIGPCDQWGRVYPASLRTCPKCGQPSGDGYCTHKWIPTQPKHCVSNVQFARHQFYEMEAT